MENCPLRPCQPSSAFQQQRRAQKCTRRSGQGAGWASRPTAALPGAGSGRKVGSASGQSPTQCLLFSLRKGKSSSQLTSCSPDSLQHLPLAVSCSRLAPGHRAGHSAGPTEQGTKGESGFHQFPPGSRGRVKEVQAQGRVPGVKQAPAGQ